MSREEAAESTKLGNSAPRAKNLTGCTEPGAIWNCYNRPSPDGVSTPSV